MLDDSVVNRRPARIESLIARDLTTRETATGQGPQGVEQSGRGAGQQGWAKMASTLDPRFAAKGGTYRLGEGALLPDSGLRAEPRLAAQAFDVQISRRTCARDCMPRGLTPREATS